MSSQSITRLITPWRVIMAALLSVGLYLVFMRFYYGLGSVTNLSDARPWGMWIGFDILAGIGLAAGGFVMAATVYVFQVDKFKPLVRMSILTAMLGYLIFIIGLLLEIGRPWNMWRVMTNWNIHSPLFEVAWCVILYTTVLMLEFSLVVFEKFGWTKLIRLHHKAAVVLVIMGVLLSTLHQSTLGTLFTIAPSKMHVLWYSPLQPIIFFISCIAAGMAMIGFEAFLSKRFLNHEVPVELLSTLIRVMSSVLALYAFYRFFELAYRGNIGAAFVPGMAALLFWLENLLFVIIPMTIVILAGRKISGLMLFFASFSAVLGFIMHRFNIAISSFELVNPTGYFPSWMEFVITACLVVGGFIAAGLAVYLFPIHPDAHSSSDKKEAR